MAEWVGRVSSGGRLMKDVSSLTDIELAMEIEELQSRGGDPDRLEKLKNEAQARAYGRR